MATLYFEDFSVGDCFNLGPREVTKAEIIRFAQKFDPQPMHLNEEAAKATMVGGLCASGWQSAALLMRMIYDAILHDSSSLGAPGVTDLAWPQPLRPGDILTGQSSVTEVRASKSNPKIGLVYLHHVVGTQSGGIVCQWDNPIFFGRRNTSGGAAQ